MTNRKFKDMKFWLAVLLVVALFATLPACGKQPDQSDDVCDVPNDTDGILSVSAGLTHTLAVKNDGSLWAWGENYYGQLGDGKQGEIAYGASEYSSVPVKIMDDVAAVSAGGTHSMAIKNDGSLWAWGGNYCGQIGNGTNRENETIPVKVMDDVAAVSAGYEYTMAIKTDGSLWGWGDNYYGQLGNGKGKSINEYEQFPVKIMDNVAVVSAGYGYTMAIKKDGCLWTWGQNDYGQLGNGKLGEDEAIPVKIIDDVAAVSAGGTHSMAIKKDGSLWAWGYNEDGRLGSGKESESESIPIKIMDNTVAVSAGNAHTVAIQKDGSLWAWGNNTDGQLGNGKHGRDESSNIPIEIMHDVIAVSAGYHTMAIQKDGKLWAWGANWYGQLGNGIEFYDPNALSDVPIEIMDGIEWVYGSEEY